MHIVEDIDGTTVARGYCETGKPDSAAVTLLAASGFATNGTYFPAESITVSGIEGLIKLRTMLDDLILEAR